MKYDELVDSAAAAVVTLAVVISILLLLSGCGHNTLTYMSGKRTELGVTMNAQGYPVFGYDSFEGEALAYVMKDNTLVNVAMSDNSETTANKEGIKDTPNKIKGLMIYTGSQTTGYDVDLAEAIAKYDVDKAKEVAAKKNVLVVDAKVKDGKLEVSDIELPTKNEAK